MVSAPVTFVLLHGGNNTGRYWELVQPLLAAPSLALDLPGRRHSPGDLTTLTLDQVATSELDDIREADVDGPIVVVAHSSGALAVPRLANLLGPQLRHVVLSPGTVPPDGGNAIDAMKEKHRQVLRDHLADLIDKDLPRTTSIGSDDPERLRTSYGGPPLDDAQMAIVASPGFLVEDSLNFYADPVSWSSMDHIPLTYVRTVLDRVQTPEMQDEFLSRVPWATTIDLEAGHLPAITAPDALAAILNTVAARLVASTT